MKNFLYKVLLFIIPALGLLTITDYLFSMIIKESNYFHIDAWYDLMHGRINADIVVMGNSRAEVHVDPLILDSILGVSTYNLGFNGSAINRQIGKYNLFRLYNKKPKVIIQNIDVWSLGNPVFEREQFFPYFWNKPMRDQFFPSEPFSLPEKYVPFYRYYHNFSLGTFYCVLKYKSKQQFKGYHGVESTWNGTAFKEVESIKFIPNDTTIMMFDNYLSKANAEGIKIIFVYSPLYIGATKKIENLKEMHDKYQKYADKYNIPILDYTYADICSDTTCFFNAMHLNKKGAEIFSRELATDIKRLNIIYN